MNPNNNNIHKVNVLFCYTIYINLLYSAYPAPAQAGPHYNQTTIVSQPYSQPNVYPGPHSQPSSHPQPHFQPSSRPQLQSQTAGPVGNRSTKKRKCCTPHCSNCCDCGSCNCGKSCDCGSCDCGKCCDGCLNCLTSCCDDECSNSCLEIAGIICIVIICFPILLPLLLCYAVIIGGCK